MSSIKNKGPAVLGAAIFLNFFCGLGYIWSVIAKQLIGQLGWTSVQASVPFTVFSICFALSMLLLGPVQDKKGPRFISTLGSILIGGGLFLSGFALTPVLLTITFGGMTGFGLGSMYAATVPPAMKWFSPEKRGTINGAVVAAVALASIMYAPLAKVLMTHLGIAPTFWIIGGFLLVALTSVSQLLANPPADHMAPAAKAAKAGNASDMTVVEMLKTGNFYKMWLMFVLSASASLMVVGHAAKIAAEQASWSGGFVLVILLAVANGGGRFFGGYLSDKLGQPNLMRLTFIVQIVNMFLFRFYQSPLLLMIGVALAGIAYGISMVVFSAATATQYGVKNFGANYGLVFTAWGLAGVFGPLPTAIVFDATGSYNLAYIISGIMVVVALIIALTYKTRVAGKAA